MTHAEMNELYELYSLGALDHDDAVRLDEHVAQGCEYCLEHIVDAVNFTAQLSGMAELVPPRAGMRKRVMACVQPEKSTGSRSWIAGFALLAAACACLAVFSFWSVQQARDRGAELQRVLEERNQLRGALQILTEQQTRTVRFGETGKAAHGWLFVNRETGFVFVGSNLPQVAEDRVFELWLVPSKGSPAPAGLFRPDSTGQFVLTSRMQITPSQYTAVAVSVEPRSGSNAPTTKPLLIVPLS
jgi:Anti-sigma-K factor rskA